MTKKLKFLAFALIAVLTCVGFASCSDNDDEPKGDELTSIIVGDWAQDGDNDIFCVYSNGTGVVYGSPELYAQKKDGASFTWTYKDGWVKAGVAGVQEEELRAESVSTNKIIWRRYEANPNIPADLDYLEKDAFGYYELWTWERYTK